MSASDDQKPTVTTTRDSESGKAEFDSTQYAAPHERPVVGEAQPADKLHRGLEARHITMIAIGGALGKMDPLTKLRIRC